MKRYRLFRRGTTYYAHDAKTNKQVTQEALHEHSRKLVEEWRKGQTNQGEQRD